MINYTPIRVVASDPAWPAEYERRAASLRHALGDAVVRIDHIGSTAVPGLDAKPAIDVQISVGDVEAMAYRAAVEGLGYTFHPAGPSTPTSAVPVASGSGSTCCSATTCEPIRTRRPPMRGTSTSWPPATRTIASPTPPARSGSSGSSGT